ncbi:MAG: hypothetical protein FWE67_03610 [Planctomycetaceae bacterium]|nr:hypothetical protein [Planctomycetaceae bacterium]
MQIIAKRVDLVLPKLGMNLRSSRATELINQFPAHVCNAIMGHTEQVAMAHYRQVLESDYAALAGLRMDKKEVAKKVAEPAGNTRFLTLVSV